MLNDGMVGFANTTSREIIDHLFISYGITTEVDLEHHFENMRKTWDIQQPVEIVFKKIPDCVDYAEVGGVTIGPAQKFSVAYTKIFATLRFMSACHRWNEKEATYNMWASFKINFAAAHRQYKQVQGE
jgi:hypothetical protein